jgi:hypothetical protein
LNINNMGQVESCCGAPQKTTRTGGKITYGNNKKKMADKKNISKQRDTDSSGKPKS